MPTVGDVAHHLDMAKRGAEALLRDAAPEPRATIPELDRLLDQTEAVAEAVYQLASKLDPCAAPGPEGRMCLLRSHGRRRDHEATRGGSTYSWPWAVDQVTGQHRLRLVDDERGD